MMMMMMMMMKTCNAVNRLEPVKAMCRHYRVSLERRQNRWWLAVNGVSLPHSCMHFATH